MFRPDVINGRESIQVLMLLGDTRVKSISGRVSSIASCKSELESAAFTSTNGKLYSVYKLYSAPLI